MTEGDAAALFDAALNALIDEIAAGAWFTACGVPLVAADMDDVAALATSFGFPDAPVTAVANWHEAAALMRRADWSRAWWERETAAEAALRERIMAAFGSARCSEGLSRVVLAASALVGPAALALAHASLADAALQRVAAGAAAQACHQAALARGAGAAGHGFEAKFRLYTAGHFPLGVVGGQFFVL